MNPITQYIPEEEIHSFFAMLNDNAINYLLIKNIASELPCSLIDGKDIDILVHIDSKTEFAAVMAKSGFNELTPPFGKENGWTFTYAMPEYQFWVKNNPLYTFYIDANFVLCCKGLMSKHWVPLNESINKSVWENKVFDEKNEWWIMDDKNMLLYLLVRCVFDKNSFSDAYVNEIEKRKHLLPRMRDELATVFFKYTPRLSELVLAGRYDGIFQDYIAFDGY